MKKRFLTVFLSVAMCLLSAFSMIGCKGKTFTVTFDPDGGELVSGELVQVVESASDIVEPELKKEGYTLKGWDTVLAEIDSDTTVKALWDKAKFTVKFVVNEGQHVKGSGELIQAVTSGEELVEPKFTREGYTLTWDTDLKTITSDCVVKGDWNPNKYVLSFQDENGNPIAGIDDMEVTYDSGIGTLPEYSVADFNCWKNKRDGKKIFDDQAWKYAYDVVAVPYIYKFDYRISYELASGSFELPGGLTAETGYDEGRESIAIYPPKKDGHDFKGWTVYEMTISGGKGEKVEEINQPGTYNWKNPEGDRIFEAKWQIRTYDITFKINEGTFSNGQKVIVIEDVVYGGTVTTPKVNVASGDREPDDWKFTIDDQTYILLNGENPWHYDINEAVFEAHYKLKFEITLNLTCTVRGRTVTSTIPEGSAITYTFLEGEGIDITKFPTATPEDTYEYTFTGWKYRVGNVNTGALVTVDVSANKENFEGYPIDNNYVVHITVYACCRANWTPAY
ncbi:MAG: hypothetical protein E7346_04000 [Clostridiales bacterium]|nr:hypothetical protein [Clostridiales bacterium]